jgi:hypothetical protein
MDNGKLDHWLKRLWLVNGIGLLLLIVAGIVAILYSTLSPGRESAAVAAGAAAERANDAPRAVRFNLPQEIRGTSTQIVLVHYGLDFAAGGPRKTRIDISDVGSSGGTYYGDDDGPSVNVLFLTPGQPGRMLLDRPAFIREVRYPESARDSLRHWIEYEIALDDRNQDGKLDADDSPALWVTDLDGSRLTRVLPAGYRFWRADPQLDGRTLRIAAFADDTGKKSLAESEQPERTFIYDVASRHLQSFTQLDSLAGAAARIVGRRIQH